MAPRPTFEIDRKQPLPESLSPECTEIRQDEGVAKDLKNGDCDCHRDRVQQLEGGEKEPAGVNDLPEYLQTLVAGSEVCGDSYVPFSRPEWFDEEKFKRGQQFALRNIFGVIYCELSSLTLLFLFKSGLEALIFTAQSDSPTKAFKRYLSTVTRVMSWYEGDVWEESSLAHKNLQTVRRMHEAVRKSMTGSSKEELAERTQCSRSAGLRDEHRRLTEDFRTTCPALRVPLAGPRPVHVSQCDMVTTQFGFCGLILLFPDMFGIHGATERDLEGFAHFWRTIGYLLGIEDRYNMCAGDLTTVRQRGHDLIDHWVRPSFHSATQDWLHMSRCVFDGLNYFIPCSTFELLLLYLCRVLNIAAPKLEASLNIVQYCVYQYTVFMFTVLTYVPGFWALHNWLIHFAMLVFKCVSLLKS